MTMHSSLFAVVWLMAKAISFGECCPDKVCVSGSSSSLSQDFDNTYIKQSEDRYHHSGGDYSLFQCFGKWYIGDKDDGCGLTTESYFESASTGNCPVGLSYKVSHGGGSSALNVEEGECGLVDSAISLVVGPV